MENSNEFNNLLKTVKLDNGKILYNLSCTTDSLKYFTKDKILKYVNDYYIKSKPSSKVELINDLNTFKTYRDNIEKNLQLQGIISGFLSIISTIVSIIIAYELGVIQSSPKGNLNLKIIIDNLNWLLIVGVVMVIGSIAILLGNFCKNSEINKVKVLNNAIYILEALKEEIYNNPEWRIEDEKDEDQEIETEDSIEITKPEDSTEDTENDKAIEEEIIKVEIIDHSNKADINFIKGASCMAVLLLSIAKMFGKKK